MIEQWCDYCGARAKYEHELFEEQCVCEICYNDKLTDDERKEYETI